MHQTAESKLASILLIVVAIKMLAFDFI